MDATTAVGFTGKATQIKQRAGTTLKVGAANHPVCRAVQDRAAPACSLHSGAVASRCADPFPAFLALLQILTYPKWSLTATLRSGSTKVGAAGGAQQSAWVGAAKQREWRLPQTTHPMLGMPFVAGERGPGPSGPAGSWYRCTGGHFERQRRG